MKESPIFVQSGELTNYVILRLSSTDSGILYASENQLLTRVDRHLCQPGDVYLLIT